MTKASCLLNVLQNLTKPKYHVSRLRYICVVFDRPLLGKVQISSVMIVEMTIAVFLVFAIVTIVAKRPP